MKKRNVILLLGSFLLLLSGLSPVAPVFTTTNLAEGCTALEEFKFECWTLDWDLISVDAGKAIAEALEEIGMEMTVVELDDAVFYDTIDAGGRYDKPGGKVVSECRDYQVYEMSEGYGPAPNHVYFRAHSSQDYPMGSCDQYHQNATLDAALELSQNASTTAELKSALNDVQKYAAETLPYYPLFLSDDSHIIRKEWTGYQQLPGGIFTSFNIWSSLTMTNGGDEKFVMAYPSDAKNINPFEADDGRSAWFALNLYEKLIYYDKTLGIIPWLAESYTRSADGKQVNFTIRQNIKWHDFATSGKYLTPEDVKHSIEMYIDYDAGPYYAYVETVDKVTIDGQVVVVDLKQPYSWILEDLGELYILPKHIWDGENPEDTKWETDTTTKSLRVGTGPFKWVSGLRESGYVLERNPDYWYDGGTGMPEISAGKPGSGTYPKIENLTITVVSEEMTRILGMNTGDFDSERYEANPPALKAVINATYGNLKVVNTPSQWDYYFQWNHQVKPFDDVIVRRAMAYAMDVEAIGEFAREEWSTPTYSVIPEAFWPDYFNPNIEKYEVDIAKANKLLDDAGYKDIDDDGIREMPGAGGGAPGFEIALALVGLFVLVPIVSQQKRKK
ncbi:MAG: ABC transporter substrate-binding protein [Candidatus Hodarchaeota archaeon]